jgi:LysR family hydrogen peroxide-inducible transcriptional activator
MTLQQLEYIVAVDSLRHFAKAAEQCRVTQPTLSAMIQKLEEELGVKIFDRGRQPVCPTAVGSCIIQQARDVLVQAGKIKNIIEEEQHSLSGIFRLGILPTIAPYLLPRFFPQLAKKYPQLDIRVTEMKTRDIKSAILRDEIDAGIVAGLDDMDNFVQTTLLYDQFFGYISRDCSLFKNERIRTSEVVGQQLWLLDEGHCFRDQLVRFCQLETARASQQAYRLGSMETFMRMVESDRGITFIPELAVLQLSDTQRELVRPFAVPIPTRRIVMLTARDFIRTTLLNVLTEEIRAAVPREMLKLKGTQQVV